MTKTSIEFPRKICVVTGTRAEYGLLKNILFFLKGDKHIDLQLVVTGMHLSNEFGLTFKEIEKDGFKITSKLEMLLSSDNPSSVVKSIGVEMLGLSDILDKLEPNLVLVVGDRYEILAAAFSALVFKIPIAHIHGGEKTIGAFDESIRHSLTKMSSIHFVATNEYRKRVIQLGEDPKSVFTVGGLGVDNIKKINLLKKKELEKKLKFKLGEKSFVVAFHPVTNSKFSSKDQFEQLLMALDHYPGIDFIFTYPNSDPDNKIIRLMIDEFVLTKARSIAFESLGSEIFLSLLSTVDGIIGNSSCGLLEAPTFKIATVNIGERQEGRIKSLSIIDCPPKKEKIINSISKVYTKEFQKKLEKVKNPYGNGGASEKIFTILKSLELDKLSKKEFYDLEVK